MSLPELLDNVAAHHEKPDGNGNIGFASDQFLEIIPLLLFKRWKAFPLHDRLDLKHLEISWIKSLEGAIAVALAIK